MTTNLLIPLFHSDLYVPALDGKEMIYNSADIFDAYIDHTDLRDWGLNTPSIPSPGMHFKVKQLTRDTTWEEMLQVENKDLKAIALTQSQIVYLCKQYKVDFRTDGHPENFFMHHRGGYFVVQVRVFDRKLGVYLYQYLKSNEVHPAAENRLIVPINKFNW